MAVDHCIPPGDASAGYRNGELVGIQTELSDLVEAAAGLPEDIFRIYIYKGLSELAELLSSREVA